ncbi:hypothetical protein MHU86_6559 [Fragilaria crotonensis]|nr:hypothetical protein MHU86_6559 [Fragilaria crotonensis]
MTMTAHAALPSPPDPAAYHDPHHPTYGFYTTEWKAIPRPTAGVDWFSVEERYRRDANAHAYKQHGTPQNWSRYVTLGFFVYDDCTKFDTLWMKYSADPIICHRMVWYNFMYHVDRKLEISKTLSAWATDVSQPYLQRHAPQYLAINTIDMSWTDYVQGDRDIMDIEVTQWTQVGSKKQKTQQRASSPNTLNASKVPPESFTTDSANVSFSTFERTEDNSPVRDLSTTNMPTSTDDCGSPNKKTTSSNSTTASDTSFTVEKQSVFNPDLNVPTNDGTYRLTFRWSPQGDFSRYNEQSPLWLTDVHAMLCELFPDNDCFFYRWESRDLLLSSEITTLSPGELREFLSPNIAFLSATSQIIFGARVCFAAKFPCQWRNKENTVTKLAEHKVQVKISNSTTTSGKIVTAGYILFKAARTTQRTHFLQSLRQQLPKETPFFDIILFHRTPMEQKINHLVIQCGETHVSPLSQALSALLTGHNSPLFLPRIALAQLQPSQISEYFEMQDVYAKTLKSFPLFPTLINLDKIRKEIFENGTVVERSTREWARTIFQDVDDPAARCEVVNGGYDQKAYLLVPRQYAQQAADHLRQYRLRLNPIGKREARFRDSLSGLPSVIHIDHSTQKNLDLLGQMSSKDIWKNAPSSVRGITTEVDNAEDLSTTQRSRGKRAGPKASKLPTGAAQSSVPNNLEHGDDNTAFTQSATQSRATASVMSSDTTRRLNELEALFRRQQQETAETSTLTSQTATRLDNIESKLGRIDDMDAVLHDSRDKLAVTMERQQDSHVQIVDLNIRVSKLMDVIDRMATRIEVLTATIVKGEHEHQVKGTEHNRTTGTKDPTRRRTLMDMRDLTESTEHVGVNRLHFNLVQKSDSPSINHVEPTDRNESLQANSPTKKKSRSLHDELEEMSLGSTEFEDELEEETLVTFQPHSAPPDISSTMDASDDSSSILPNLDTQYNQQSDPEEATTNDDAFTDQNINDWKLPFES